jgi:hypothetical protein
VALASHRKAATEEQKLTQKKRATEEHRTTQLVRG